MGCDESFDDFFNWIYAFLLTHPVWDVTLGLDELFIEFGISTHTSRVGCDQAVLMLTD